MVFFQSGVITMNNNEFLRFRLRSKWYGVTFLVNEFLIAIPLAFHREDSSQASIVHNKIWDEGRRTFFDTHAPQSSEKSRRLLLFLLLVFLSLSSIKYLFSFSQDGILSRQALEVRSRFTKTSMSRNCSSMSPVALLSLRSLCDGAEDVARPWDATL